jgi:molybdopterin converting factor small subunit
VRIEFYGLARLRAGRKEFVVSAATVGAALAATDDACPELRALCGGRISASYLVSTDGEQFTTDTQRVLSDGDALLIFGADAGG